MRLDIPSEEPRSIRRRESEIPPPSDVEPTRVPESPIARRLERLQQRAQENHAHYVAQPRPERPLEPNHEPDRPRQKEHRPRRTREGIAVNIRGLRLRQEEQTLLAETGRFRVLAVKDIARTIYGGDKQALETDLRYLEERNLVSVDTVPARNDGRWLRPQRTDAVARDEMPRGITAVGVFLFFGATIASLAGATLAWPGTSLDRTWVLNPTAHRQLATLGKPAGILFLLLSATLAVAATGWFQRRLWRWRLAVAVITTQVLGDLVNFFRGDWLRGGVGFSIAAALLFYLLRPAVRAVFHGAALP